MKTRQAFQLMQNAAVCVVTGGTGQVVLLGHVPVIPMALAAL